MTRGATAKRRAGVGAAGLALLLGLTLGACAQSNTPDEYNTLTQQNFLESCTNFYFDNTNDTLAITSNTVSDKAQSPPNQSQCQCMYDVFTGPNGDGTDGGMPINETAAKAQAGYTGPNFTTLNADLKTDPQGAWDDLPDEFKNPILACGQGGGGSSGTTTTTSGGGSTTTTATEGTTTTSS